MVEITVDVAKLKRQLDTIGISLNNAVSKALNDAAFDLRNLWLGDLRTYIDRPTPFTTRSGAVLVDKSRPDNLIAVTKIGPLQNVYLKNIVEGGIRETGDLATTQLGSLVPDKAQLNNYGNFPGGPKRWLAGLESRYDGDAFVGTPGYKEGVGPRPAVYERLSDGQLRLLAVFEQTVNYESKVPLEQTTELAFNLFDQIFDKVINAALK